MIGLWCGQILNYLENKNQSFTVKIYPMKQIELSNILKDFKSNKMTNDEAVLKIMRVFSPTGTIMSDKYCNCNKPWGVSRYGCIYCAICEKPIKLN